MHFPMEAQWDLVPVLRVCRFSESSNMLLVDGLSKRMFHPSYAFAYKIESAVNMIFGLLAFSKYSQCNCSFLHTTN